MANKPFKIDLHTHILPPDWPNLRDRYGYGGFVQLEHHGPGCARMQIDGQPFREIQSNSWDPEVRIKECDRHGVDMQVLSTVPVMFSYWAKPEHTYDLSRLLNDHIADVVRAYPDRFAGLATVPLQSPDLAIRELERCVKDLGLKGAQIGSHINEWDLNHPELFPFFEAAQDLGAALFVHPWDMVGRDRMKPYWLAWLIGMPTETALAISAVIFGGVLQRLPKLRICFAHGGGAFPGLIGRIEHGFQVRPDLCAIDNHESPRSYLGRFYLDSLVHDPDVLRNLIRLFGSQRIALGSDYPFPLGEWAPGQLIEQMAELSFEAQCRLLAGTAIEFLNLEAEAPAVLETERQALRLSRETGLRERFCIPCGDHGKPWIYFCGNSLGLQPRGAMDRVEQEMKDWANLGVEGHFHAERPWYSYHEMFRESGARLVGAIEGEVVMMNTLTVNLHLMMVSFYRPTAKRWKILIDYPPFPSDLYSVRSQIQHHGYDPEEGLLLMRPREGEHCLRLEDIKTFLEDHGKEIALLLFNGINYVTGQWHDMEQITAMAQAQGCSVGWDLAHAAGNVPMRLHDWNVDFAIWCNYKYLNAGPGAVGGCFVHQRHGENPGLNRFAGWWGNDPESRFRMHLEEEFLPKAGADGWQLSNPPILSLAPLRASLDLFDEVGMDALRKRSLELTGHLEELLDRLPAGKFEMITPRDPEQRGCQLSLSIQDRPKEIQKALQESGVICDYREPNVIRVAPVPLYNTLEEVKQFVSILEQVW